MDIIGLLLGLLLGQVDFSVWIGVFSLVLSVFTEIAAFGKSQPEACYNIYL